MSRSCILTALAIAGATAALAGPALGAGTPPSSGPVFIGEAKNELPFTRPVEQPQTILLHQDQGFVWRDGALGALAGVSLAAAGAGSLVLRRRSKLAI
jgi:hypothetical protein